MVIQCTFFNVEPAYFNFLSSMDVWCLLKISSTLIQYIFHWFQFNLSKNSLEVSSIEKYLQLQQDSVPCRVRAKRGCATHPRSIAERVSSYLSKYLILFLHDYNCALRKFNMSWSSTNLVEKSQKSIYVVFVHLVHHPVSSFLQFMRLVVALVHSFNVFVSPDRKGEQELAKDCRSCTILCPIWTR